MGRFSLDDDEDLDDYNSIVQSSSIHNHNRYDYNENPFPYDDGAGSPLWIVNDEKIRSDVNNDKHLKRHRFWVRHMFLIGIIVLLQKYLPPPPPPNDTWHEYISTSTESIMCTAMNMLALTFYITHGCLVNLKSDVTLHIQTWKSRYQQDGLHHLLFFRTNNDSASTTGIWNDDDTLSCSVQRHMEYHSIQQYLSKRIVGQKPSIHIIAEAISSSWQSSNRPLSLLLTGPIGVGKYKTVKLLSRMMMSKDNENGSSTWDDLTTHTSNCWNRRDVPSCQHAILEMNGFDYKLDYYNDNELGTQMTVQKNMVDRILHHIHQRQGKGAVILIKHVEQLSDSHRSDLIRIMQSPTVVTLQKQNLNTMIKRYQQLLGIKEVSKEVEISLQNCVFLLTTDVGTNTIFDAIRHGSHQMDSIQQRIRQDLKHDLGQYFHMVDYVIPYGPLQFSHMKSALDMEIKDMNCVFQREMGHGIQITGEALHFLAGPRMIEYIEVPYTEASNTKQDSSFVFAADGGHALPVKAIESVVYKAIQNVPFRSQHDFVRIDFRSDDDTLILERCNNDNSSDINDPFCFDQVKFSVHDLLVKQV